MNELLNPLAEFFKGQVIHYGLSGKAERGQLVCEFQHQPRQLADEPSAFQCLLLQPKEQIPRRRRDGDAVRAAGGADGIAARRPAAAARRKVRRLLQRVTARVWPKDLHAVRINANNNKVRQAGRLHHVNQSQKPPITEKFPPLRAAPRLADQWCRWRKRPRPCSCLRRQQFYTTQSNIAGRNRQQERAVTKKSECLHGFIFNKHESPRYSLMATTDHCQCIGVRWPSSGRFASNLSHQKLCWRHFPEQKYKSVHQTHTQQACFRPTRKQAQQNIGRHFLPMLRQNPLT